MENTRQQTNYNKLVAKKWDEYYVLDYTFNHSNDFNVRHNQDPENMIYKAARDIKKGEELYVNYGTDYWNSRNN